MNKKQKKHAAGVKMPCKNCGENYVAITSRIELCTRCIEHRSEPSMPVVPWLNRPIPEGWRDQI